MVLASGHLSSSQTEDDWHVKLMLPQLHSRHLEQPLGSSICILVPAQPPPNSQSICKQMAASFLVCQLKPLRCADASTAGMLVHHLLITSTGALGQRIC